MFSRARLPAPAGKPAWRTQPTRMAPMLLQAPVVLLMMAVTFSMRRHSCSMSSSRRTGLSRSGSRTSAAARCAPLPLRPDGSGALGAPRGERPLQLPARARHPRGPARRRGQRPARGHRLLPQCLIAGDTWLFPRTEPARCVSGGTLRRSDVPVQLKCGQESSHFSQERNGRNGSHLEY